MKDFADSIIKALQESRAVVVTAPPGAGKSTVLPLHFLEATGCPPKGDASACAGRQQPVPKLSPGRILMLEPRRLAARQIAERVAFLRGEPVGKTVGYRVRFESRVSKETRLEILTEGILTRMLVDDPTLDGVSMVIFDEFHERSLQSDVALALTREAQKIVRPDLKIVIMSATIDTESISRSLDAPVLEAGGRKFPVEIIRGEELPESSGVAETAEAVAHYVRMAHREHEGDILAFLPGEAEIRRCAELLSGAFGTGPTAHGGNETGAPQTRVCPLYGMMPFEQQHRAIAPSAPGERKIVLATPIAETSLTIEGVRVVVDSGLYRKLVFDPQTGLSRLETRRISADMADQRTGRAGRVAPGVCYRLWSLATETRMAPCRIPEILDSDLAPMVLDIAAWGENDPSRLPWTDVPPQFALAGAKSLLRALGAVDESGKITDHGLELAALPCHPRIASMLVRAEGTVQKALAADLAALLEEKDPLPDGGADLSLRVAGLRKQRCAPEGRKGWQRIITIAAQYRSIAAGHAAVPEDNSAPDAYAIAVLLAAAYPERVAKAHPDGCGKFILSCGDIACIDADDSLAACEWLAVASLSSRKGGPGRIFLAAPLDPMDLRDMMKERDVVRWDSRSGSVIARHELNLGGLQVSSRPIHADAREEINEAICQAALKDGRSMLNFSDDVQNLQRRVAAVALWHPELELPDLSTDAVLSRAGEWLPAFLGRATTADELKKIDLHAALWSLLDYGQQQAVDNLAPTHIEVPTGSRIRVEYRQGADAPVLRVRLQECFGLVETPRVDGGRKAVLMELLSPGFKPVQLTSDLRSFWEGTYFEVKKELRRRYPKHSWPDNPLEAMAVRGIRKKEK